MRKPEIESWVADVARHTEPAAIHWCNGGADEADELTRRMLASGTLERLAIDLRSWLAELERSETFLTKFQGRLPSALWNEHRSLRERFHSSIS